MSVLEVGYKQLFTGQSCGSTSSVTTPAREVVTPTICSSSPALVPVPALIHLAVLVIELSVTFVILFRTSISLSVKYSHPSTVSKDLAKLSCDLIYLHN